MSVASLVEKATSDLLISPDWAKNLELCDIVNSDPGQAKEVVKAAKKRLAIKNPTVQLLTLTVLETLTKNCGDAVHQQIAERDVLHEMVKIVKKKTDMSVRDKILVLLDSWQEAFGGQRGRYPQYYAAYDELRRFGIEFPQREDAVPIFTPPQTHPITAYPPPPPPPYAVPGFVAAPGFVASQAPTPLDGTIQPLSLADLDNARGGMEVLSEMLNAIDPLDKAALKEELIVELVEQCRTTQKQVMNLVSTTSDETLLFQALSLNDDLQKVLAKRDAIASGNPVPLEDVPRAAAPANFARDEEECEDDFAQLSHRTRRNADQKPTAPSQPQPVRIPGPPTPIAKIPGPPGAIRKQSSGVDLLSGDMFSGTQSAEAVVNNSNQHVQKPEDLENLNPFALQQQVLHQQQPQPPPHQPAQSSSFTPATSTGQYPAPWESASPASSQSQPLNPQQQALLYGSTETQKYPQGPAKTLPPPPIKHSQRQQYFQQHHLDPRHENELIGRTQKLSMDSPGDEDMQNPYAALYSQQKQEQQQQMNSSRAASVEGRSDSLFSDLVELQSAKLKSSGRSM